MAEHQGQSQPLARGAWSDYAFWEGYGDPDLMDASDMAIPEFRHRGLLEAADRRLTRYFDDRFQEWRGAVIEDWKAQGVYPYTGEPTSLTEEIEREIFDIVAVVASPAIGRDRDQRRFSIALLQEAVRSDPSRLRKILDAVVGLSEQHQGVVDGG